MDLFGHKSKVEIEKLKVRQEVSHEQMEEIKAHVTGAFEAIAADVGQTNQALRDHMEHENGRWTKILIALSCMGLMLAIMVALIAVVHPNLGEILGAGIDRL